MAMHLLPLTAQHQNFPHQTQSYRLDHALSLFHVNFMKSFNIPGSANALIQRRKQHKKQKIDTYISKGLELYFVEMVLYGGILVQFPLRTLFVQQSYGRHWSSSFSLIVTNNLLEDCFTPVCAATISTSSANFFFNLSKSCAQQKAL